jgi:hypothetical protein
MNLFTIIEHLSEVDPDVLDRFNSRRAVFNSLGTVAKRTAMAASPLFLGALFQKAYAGTTSTPADILNYALTLELLEADFYSKMINSAATFSAQTPAVQTAIRLIKSHEDAHVVYLATAIRAISGAGNPVTGVTFKTSTFATLTTFAQQLQVAQVLEDTGVRAYKGRAAELTNTALLTAALQIHSVEARHAAHIRLLRGQTPWISTADDLVTNAAYTSGVTGATSTSVPLGGTTYGIPSYLPINPGRPESNIYQGAVGTQSAVDITSILGTAGLYNADDAAAAFDEPLQAAEVLDASRAGGLVG